MDIYEANHKNDVAELASAAPAYREKVQGCGTALLTELMRRGRLSVDDIVRLIEFWKVNLKGVQALLLLYDLPPLPEIVVGERGPPTAKAMHDMTKQHFASIFISRYYA